MSLKSAFIAAVAVMVCCGSAPVQAGQGCPVRSGTMLRAVTVYDGPIEDGAELEPDAGDAAGGRYGDLGSAYVHHRAISLLCVYGDGQSVRVVLRTPVRACVYAMNAQGGVKRFSCR